MQKKFEGNGNVYMRYICHNSLNYALKIADYYMSIIYESLLKWLSKMKFWHNQVLWNNAITGWILMEVDKLLNGCY